MSRPDYLTDAYLDARKGKPFKETRAVRAVVESGLLVRDRARAEWMLRPYSEAYDYAERGMLADEQRQLALEQHLRAAGVDPDPIFEVPEDE